jgi:hypothetical protein
VKSVTLTGGGGGVGKIGILNECVNANPASFVPATVRLNDVAVSVEATVAVKVKSAATALNVTFASSAETAGGDGNGMKFVDGTNPIWKVPTAPTTIPAMDMKVSPLS